MPRFSVIVPAYKVQAYLSECLDSVLSQSYADLELIAVNEDGARAAARGAYFDLRAFPPGAVTQGEDEPIDIFANGHWRGSRSAQPRAAFRQRFCPHDDGRAAERVVRHVVPGGTAGLPEVIPLAERRPVPSAAAGLGRSPLATVPQPGGCVPVTEGR